MVLRSKSFTEVTTHQRFDPFGEIVKDRRLNWTRRNSEIELRMKSIAIEGVLEKAPPQSRLFALWHMRFCSLSKNGMFSYYAGGLEAAYQAGKLKRSFSLRGAKVGTTPASRRKGKYRIHITPADGERQYTFEVPDAKKTEDWLEAILEAAGRGINEEAWGLLCSTEAGEEWISAAESGNIDIMQKLLSKGADVDAVFGGRTALHCACARGDEVAMLFLLQHGARINKRQEINGMTPLLLAVQAAGCENNSSMISILCRLGANCHATNFNGLNVAHFAALHGNIHALLSIVRSFIYLPGKQVMHLRRLVHADSSRKPFQTAPLSEYAPAANVSGLAALEMACFMQRLLIKAGFSKRDVKRYKRVITMLTQCERIISSGADSFQLVTAVNGKITCVFARMMTRSKSWRESSGCTKVLTWEP